MEELSPEMAALQADFQDAFTADAGFFFPYTLTPTPGASFRGNVWAADVRGRAYAQAVQTTPKLAQTDVRFLTVAPGDEPPDTQARIPFQGGMLTLHHWAETDPLSGETIAACSWSK